MARKNELGRVLEDLVASLHDLPGITVEKRVKLPSVTPGSKRRSEIDVLLSAEVAGYPVRMGIECKNLESKVTVGHIRQFLSVLRDVGIPPVYGLYVAASGYTEPALELARDNGIRLLALEGLDASRLAVEVGEALQSLVYVLGTWIHIQRFIDVPVEQFRDFTPLHFDIPRSLGNGTSAVLNRIWQLWVTDQIPMKLGVQTVLLDLPEGFVFEPNDQPVTTGIVNVRLDVTGHVASLAGTSRHVVLRNAATSEVEKRKVQTSFPAADSAIQLLAFETEEELTAHLSSCSVRIDWGRVRVPRLVSERTYWPPTLEALEKIRSLQESGEDVSFFSVEGTNLTRAWEFAVERDTERTSE